MANDFTGAEVFEIVGMNYGQFTAEGTGEVIDYASVHCIVDFPTGIANYHTEGRKTVVLKCVTKDVFAGVKPGDKVCCFFNSKKKVAYMAPAPSSK